MLIYVIPLVILIIVLIVFKKRQDAQESDKAKTKTVKAKKPGSASKAAPQRTKVVEPVGVTKKSATPLSAETRKKIEGLIQERNFFAAEAQINQALNRDNSQHELYLLLLDIHILQKDEFAISQLLNHIRSLHLEEILAQAEAKQREFEKSSSAAQDTIDFPSAQLKTSSAQEAASTSDAFADLVAPAPSNELAFEQLQQDFQSSKPTPIAEPVADIQPLEFNFEPKTTSVVTPKAEEVPVPAAPSIDFEFQSTSTDIQTTAVTETAPVLDFKLDLEQPAPVETAPTVSEEIKPLDFSFSLDTSVPAAEKTAVPATEFDLSSLTVAAPVAEPATQTNLSGMDFKLDHLETMPEAPAATVMSFDLPATPAQAAVDQHDPLVQSFPELLDVNEASLNLDLAQQYIQLGAYAAAREIIAEREAEYTPEQQQRAEQLLNQIAS
ncbi:fimbrial protein FimV [Acinetobacter lwoffii]|uniref:Fimbrial protein FimV n=1 Tax=Acinetobacter lwoffii TaxID=28090 RepID=A0AAW8ASM9_ACILW|nr:fimbrial protein FimV [Acinetobacter lwoffii]MDP1315496.1 fimbrial protein FimV [Acinetobacter lwoffii]MDP1369511.1 fimbrial protein FimV [Acinetobacter lwoffii]MDP1389933.1 fimbrial protein FimV [Acinetobacter lwoffii]MDP1446621.1 fimbrial protein FimV [Acinetobacter lwoffii]